MDSFFLELCRELNIVRGDELYHEIYSHKEILCLAGEYDQLSLGGFACLEHCDRRFFSVVEAHSSGAGSANWAIARHLSGARSITDLMTREMRSDVTKKAKGELGVLSFRQRAAGNSRGLPGLEGAVALGAPL